MGRITLRQAADWCGGTVDEKYEHISFLGAGNDTRSLNPQSLFVALQGVRDGHDYIPAAMEKGAAAVLCSRRVGDYPAIYVDDPRIALGRIAAAERQRLGLKVVGVTGSVGKSTTKEMIAQVLSGTYRTARTPVNHNNDIGMPMAILAMPEDTQVAVLEMGMNHFREIAYLSNIARPDYAVIVNVGTAHIEYLGTVQGIRQAKMEILEGMEPEGTLFLNGDCGLLRELPRKPVQNTVYFGMDEGCGVRAEEVCSGSEKLTFTVKTGELRFPVTLPMEGMHFVADAMAAVSVGLALGVRPEDISARLEDFQNMDGRQKILHTENYTIINDCYNAGPESMAAALKVLGAQTGRRIAVLGDMLELGDCAEAEHYRVGRIAAENADLVFSYGVNAGRIQIGTVTGGMADNRSQCFDTQEAMIAALKRAARPGDVLLFKGSRGMHMEKVLEGFLEK